MVRQVARVLGATDADCDEDSDRHADANSYTDADCYLDAERDPDGDAVLETDDDGETGGDVRESAPVSTGSGVCAVALIVVDGLSGALVVA